MNGEIEKALEKLLAQRPYKIIVSKPAGQEKYQKIVLAQKESYYQAEQYTKQQVFHKNLRAEELPDYLGSLLGEHFLQLTAWTEQAEHSFRITKKGKLLTHRGKKGDSAPAPQESHNRQKRYLLPEGTVIPPLVDMGIFTAEGKIVRTMYDKYRQINRFVELIDDALRGVQPKELHILDFGCGKSYLTFVLYYFLTQVRGIPVQMVGLDLKEEVIRHCNETAERYGYAGLHFELGNIDGYQATFPVDMVVTLHACDTATDFALFNAVRWGAKMIFSAPCCQHELAGQMEGGALSLLTRYGIVKERAAALLTDALRANLLTCCGYQTQLLEFVELEHTPKNLLIRALKSPVSPEKRRQALEEVRAACQAFSLSPTLLRLLEGEGLMGESRES